MRLTNPANPAGGLWVRRLVSLGYSHWVLEAPGALGGPRGILGAYMGFVGRPLGSRSDPSRSGKVLGAPLGILGGPLGHLRVGP